MSLPRVGNSNCTLYIIEGHATHLLLCLKQCSMYILLPTDCVLALFGNKVFSEAGTNHLRMEQATYMMFQDLLEELEGMQMHFILYILYGCNKVAVLCACFTPAEPGVTMDAGVCAPSQTYIQGMRM